MNIHTPTSVVHVNFLFHSSKRQKQITHWPVAEGFDLAYKDQETTLCTLFSGDMAAELNNRVEKYRTPVGGH